MVIDSRPIAPDTYSFVVRIWYEGTDPSSQQPLWRGSIEHVGAGQKRYFVNLDDISRYIQEHVGPLEKRERDAAQATPDRSKEVR